MSGIGELKDRFSCQTGCMHIHDFVISPTAMRWGHDRQATVARRYGRFALAVVKASGALALACTHLLASAQLPSPAPSSAASGALQLRYAELKDRLAKNDFSRPLFLESAESRSTVSGDAYAVLNAPFETVAVAFKSPVQWCEVMILHINTKYCKAGAQATPSMLRVNIGKKTPQAIDDTFALEFAMKLAASAPDYLAIQLNAAQGPVGTSDYRIEFEAIPVAGGKTFMHLRYSYGYGVAGRLAMQGYLATVGNGKVGFTVNGADKKSPYVGGMRGAVERNTMRYYLAIEAYLASPNKPPLQVPEARFEHWFDATERYKLQLHEVDRNAYLQMKKAEYQRQLRTGLGAG